MFDHICEIKDKVQTNTFIVEANVGEDVKAMLDLWAIEEFDSYEFDLKTGVIRAVAKTVHYLPKW